MPREFPDRADDSDLPNVTKLSARCRFFTPRRIIAGTIFQDVDLEGKKKARGLSVPESRDAK